MARVLSYKQTTALVSRALALTPETLTAGFVAATGPDLAQIIELRRLVIGSDLVWDDHRYLSWRYRLGSSNQGRGECWVVKRGDEVLAMLGTEQISVVHGGRAVDGLSVMDIAVRPELEGVGLGVWMAMHLIEQSACVLAVGSNANSRAIVSRLFERLPDRRSYAHLIDFEPTLRRRLKWAVPTLLAAALAGWGMALWRGAALLTRDRGVRIEPLHRFDASVAALIAQSQAPHELSVARSEAFLNWRLVDNPRSTYAIWAARDAHRLAGYIALRMKELGGGMRVMVIEDVLVRSTMQRAAVLKALLCKVFEQASAQGCERINVIACQLENERVLRRLGFFQHRADAETLSVRCRDEALGRTIAAGAPWHLTGANTDRDE